MNTTRYLALPRLHAELLPHIDGCRTLWPGLPGRPESAWAPALPWSPSMAAACLADYERVCRDGASGSPVLTLGAESATCFSRFVRYRKRRGKIDTSSDASREVRENDLRRYTEGGETARTAVSS